MPAILSMLAGLGCATADVGPRTQIVQPGAPGETTRVIPAVAAADLSPVRHTAADVRFMQAMIGHHAQALEMAALVPSRTGRRDIQMLARRIEASQADEISMIKSWLQARGEEVSGHPDHAHGTVPGMLTEEEMARLASADGAEFDRLFLELMIKHHDGALVMVQELFGSRGAGQEPEIFTFASDVDADQRMEIERMGAMLRELQK
jgi:uncharacterized protein (DUF305 family)